MKIFNYKIIHQEAFNELLSLHSNEVSKLVNKNLVFEINIAVLEDKVRKLEEEIKTLNAQISDKDYRINDLHNKFTMEIDHSNRIINDIANSANMIKEITEKFKKL